MSKKFTIYTDGSCPVQNGPWGWAAVILQENQVIDVIKGGSNKKGTSNVAELTAVICAIKYTPEYSFVLIRSDSQSVCKAFNEKWVFSWHSKGWRRGNGLLKNKELWKNVYNETSKRNVHFEWVKGHNGNKYNEMADQIAGEMSEFYANR